MRSAIHCLIITQKIRHKEIRTKEKRCAANQCSTPFFARYARQATAVLARAGICRATDSERLCRGAGSDTPGERLPCLHEQVFAPLRSVLDACHWHAAPSAGQRTAKGFAVSCPQYRSITETLRRKQDYDHKYI